MKIYHIRIWKKFSAKEYKMVWNIAKYYTIYYGEDNLAIAFFLTLKLITLRFYLRLY